LTGRFPPETKLIASSLERLDLFDNLIWNPGSEWNDWLGDLSEISKLKPSTNSGSRN
jgi:hypothetical protein